jgi:Rps23 Pro-64 3,4-dihydroxylase Tpa1-like proline 4-hydroxylase
LSCEKIINILNEITNLNLKKSTTIFANKYTSDCFLATHTDDGNGRLAFVLHLTKNWNACWGGMYMDHTDPNNIKTVIPSFNKMVMFKVGNHETPHSVSCVTNNLTRKRISVTGWFD